MRREPIATWNLRAARPLTARTRAFRAGLRILLACLLAVLAAPRADAQTAGAQTDDDALGAYYRIEEIALPEGVDPQLGALAFGPDGRLVAAFHTGEVYTYDVQTRAWALFAEGLYEPLGLLPVRDDEILVMQKPELTRLKDTDGDGRADLYETVSDAFGFTGNYHEYAYGPIPDGQGNLFIALNVGSTGAGILPEIRGAFRTYGPTREELERAKYPNPMYSVVPYRGWIMKITPDGRTVPYASGFRSPNGIVLDAEGRLFATDNQGDWVGTSKLYHVEEGKFYGHPVSLAWKEGWKGDPLDRSPFELDRMRTREAVAFPHEVMAKSPTQPVIVPDGTFGPFAGQMLVGEMNDPRILRVMLEEVAGQVQGATVALLDGPALGLGNNRLAFGPEGSLWVGKTHLKWAGGTGIRRITWTGRTPLEVENMRLTQEGFELTFTRPVDPAVAAEAASYRVRRYYYAYQKKYGSEQMDTATVAVTKAEVAPDGRRVRLTLGALEPGYVYELDVAGLRAPDGTPVLNPLVCYTLNRLLDGTGPAPGHGVTVPSTPVGSRAGERTRGAAEASRGESRGGAQ